MERARVSLDLFTDFIKAARDVVGIIKDLKDIPKKTRREYIDVIDETMSLLDSALLLVIHRLGDLLNIARTEPSKFPNELARLQDYDEWLNIERSIRLCSSLRITASEMGGLVHKISLRDYDAVDKLMSAIFSTEAELAGFISQSLEGLSKLWKGAEQSEDKFKEAVEEVQKVKNAFRHQKNSLIETQVEFYRII